MEELQFIACVSSKTTLTIFSLKTAPPTKPFGRAPPQEADGLSVESNLESAEINKGEHMFFFCSYVFLAKNEVIFVKFMCSKETLKF